VSAISGSEARERDAESYAQIQHQREQAFGFKIKSGHNQIRTRLNRLTLASALERALV